jgi:hypothetical protein
LSEGSLLVVYFNAFGFDHSKAGIDAFHFRQKLLLSYGMVVTCKIRSQFIISERVSKTRL